MKETQHVALARVGMYGREHVVIVRPGEHGMLVHTMFYTDEIRFENEFHANVEGVGAKELELAKTFLEAIEAPFAPEEFQDVYREELQAMIAKKMSEMGAAPAPPGAGSGPASRGYPGGAEKEHRNGPQAARPGDRADTESCRPHGDQE